jgi:glycine dehydrogenase subunit 2
MEMKEMRARLLMDRSVPGRRGARLPAPDVPAAELPPARYLREEVPLPELSEPEVVRYFTRLSQRNFAVDTTFYPLGSCTMKYNPKFHEAVASSSMNSRSSSPGSRAWRR